MAFLHQSTPPNTKRDTIQITYYSSHLKQQRGDYSFIKIIQNLLIVATHIYLSWSEAFFICRRNKIFVKNFIWFSLGLWWVLTHLALHFGVQLDTLLKHPLPYGCLDRFIVLTPVFDPSILPILEPFVVRPGDDQAGRFIYNMHVSPEQLAVKIFLTFSIFCSFNIRHLLLWRAQVHWSLRFLE